jgi:WD40 repeat protein
MIKNILICCILITLMLGSCSKVILSIPPTQSPTLSTPLPPLATSTVQTPTITVSPSPTLTPLPPTPTPSPTSSPLPTNTLTPSVTPVSWGKTPLSAENVSSIVQKVVWGVGTPQDSAFSVSNNVFIQGTPFGIYLYQANDLQLIRFLPEAGKFFLSPAGDLIFTRLPDGSIQVIDLPTGEERYIFPPIAVLSPMMKDYVYLQLPADRPAIEKEYFDWVSTMRALAITPDGTLVAIGFGDASIGLWDLRSGTLVHQLKNDIVQEVSGLVFSPNGEKLLSTGTESDIAVWQVDDGQLLWRLPHIGHIVGQPFSMDGSLVALEITLETSSWVAVRETRYGGELAPQVVGKVASQAISPDNTRLVTTWYGAVKIWSIPNLILQTKLETGLDWPQASFSTDGKYILINAGEQAYFVSDLSRDEAYQAPAPQRTPEVNTDALLQMGHLPRVIGLRYPQPDQAFTWGTLSKHEAWVWDLTKNVKTIYDFGSPFTSEPDLSFSGDRLAACTEDGLLLITLADGQTSNLGRCRDSAIVRVSIDGYTAYRAVVRFSADGNTIFRTNGVLIDSLNSNNGELIYNLRGHSFFVEDLAVTSDGTYLVSSSNFQHAQGREVIWWRVDEPRQVWRWMVSVSPNSYLNTAAFQQDDHVLYTVLGGLRSWRLGDGQPDHLDTSVGSLAISPENHLLATSDYRGIHIWSLENWQELAVLSGDWESPTDLDFSPDGSSLLSTSTDGTIRLWGLP